MKLSKQTHIELQKAILEALDNRELSAQAIVLAIKKARFPGGMSVNSKRVATELLRMKKEGLLTSRKIAKHYFHGHLWRKKQ